MKIYVTDQSYFYLPSILIVEHLDEFSDTWINVEKVSFVIQDCIGKIISLL